MNEYMVKLKKTLELKLLKINEVILKITNYETLLEQVYSSVLIVKGERIEWTVNGW